MKKIYSIVTGILLTASVLAQAPQKMSYQAVIRNNSNALVTSTAVGMKISVLKGAAIGTAVYVETQKPTTNANGLVSLEIGAGTAVTGTFATINWANGPYFIKTETDPTGGNNYTILGTNELLSVPYALHARTAENFTGTIIENDPVYIGSQAANIQASDITKLSNLSGTNTGDQDLSGLASSSSVTSSLASKVDKVTGKGLLTDGTTPGQMNYWNGSAWVTVSPGVTGQTLTFCDGVPTWGDCIPHVTNPTTGKIWMDRNLGASQVATSSTDVASYGDLYQWGRCSDGHQLRTSSTTTTLSSTDVPGNSNFITINSVDFDWRSAQNNNLWQGINGINNPCPAGYRIPTDTELNAERLSWSGNNSIGAFASQLKFPSGGYRSNSDGSLGNVNVRGIYWSSNIEGIYSHTLDFDNGNANIGTNRRAYGFSVRCIKD